MMLLEDLRSIANRASAGTSFDPERRGEQRIKEYSGVLEADVAYITAHAETDDAKERLQETIDRYTAKFRSHVIDVWNSEGRIVSTMIAGRSNFPVRRMEKYNRWAHNKWTEYVEWRDRTLKAIVRSFKRTVTKDDELSITKELLRIAEGQQENMKAANKIIRSKKNVTEGLVALGFPKEIAENLQKGDFCGRTGFPTYKLTNNNAYIKRLTEKITALSKKVENTASGSDEVSFPGGKVLLNHEADRIQILFDQKPPPEMITNLKRSAFKWSPTNMAWQRQITNNAKWATNKLLNIQMP